MQVRLRLLQGFIPASALVRYGRSARGILRRTVSAVLGYEMIRPPQRRISESSSVTLLVSNVWVRQRPGFGVADATYRVLAAASSSLLGARPHKARRILGTSISTQREMQT